MLKRLEQGEFLHPLNKNIPNDILLLAKISYFLPRFIQAQVQA